MMRNKKILITGGAGFIGSYLVEKLKDENEIVIFDSFRQDALRFTNLRQDENVRVINGDVLNPGSIAGALEGITDVVHMAAVAGVANVKGAPNTTMRVNLLGTYNMLEAVKGLKLSSFVNFSTSEVYGPFAKNVKESDFSSHGPVGESRWVYSVSKVAAEHLGYGYHLEHGLPFISVRPFNIYGPRQVGGGAVRIFVERAVRNQEMRIIAEGKGIRCYCYIEDFVSALLMLMEKKGAAGQVFNIGNPSEPIDALTLAKKVITKSGSSSQITFDGSKKEDIPLRIPDVSKVEALLGWRPKVSLDDGLERTIAWGKEVYK